MQDCKACMPFIIIILSQDSGNPDKSQSVLGKAVDSVKCV